MTGSGKGVFTMVRIIFMLVFSLLWCQVIPGMVTRSEAGSSALEQLLDIFEKRGAISTREANSIRQVISEEKKELFKVGQELETKEKNLLERERILKERETAIGKREVTPAEKEETIETKPKAYIQTAPKEMDKSDQQALTSIPLEARYKDGFCLSAPDEKMVSLCIGGLLQADYRHFKYDNEDPDKNGFDLRRVRMLLEGSMLNRFDYKFEYEFEGAGSRRLLDAYVDANSMEEASLRVGQFKTPYSFEWLTKDKNLVFAERSMGYFLTPGRDLGVMAHGSLWQDAVNYGIGLFNGDGMDDSTRGDEDSPECVGRLVVSPFKNWKKPTFEHLQVGGSFGYGKIDRTNVNITVKTTGLTSFFDVAASAKFNIIRDADTRTRYGAELAWAYGPLLLSGEYFQLNFKDITTSADQFDVKIDDYYISLLWMITGENPVISNGIMQPIQPNKTIWNGGLGGLGLAMRYDVFEADDSVYDNLIIVGNSVAEAKAYSFALNWYLDPYTKLIIDYTKTKFDQPLLISRDPINGMSIYSEQEDVITTRFQFEF
jgi:phosphate-selective porin OprO/OprP